MLLQLFVRSLGTHVLKSELKRDETKKYTVPSLETKMGYFNQNQPKRRKREEKGKLPLKMPLAGRGTIIEAQHYLNPIT